MRMINAAEDDERLQFAVRAARFFGEHPKVHTYTDGDIRPGVLFALRYGVDLKSVVVFTIANDRDVCNYVDMICTQMVPWPS